VLQSVRKFWIAIIAAGVLLAITPAAEAGKLAYPVIFTKAATLKKLGILLRDYSDDTMKVTPFSRRCYYYGDGGYSISVSKSFFRRFQERGFSLRSLCMALASGIRFNPETGTHLPTYMVKQAGLSKEELMTYGAGTVSEELPFDVPDCFKRGLPYTDCKMTYGMMSGRRLSSNAVDAYRRLGVALERFLKKERSNYRGDLIYDDLHALSFAQTKDGMRLESLAGLSRSYGRGLLFATHGDYSKALPKGYGYALNLEGAAGPEASSEAVELASDERRQVNEQSLAELQALLAE